MNLSGWIFDVYPEMTGMTLWLTDLEGKNRPLRFPFAPSFYLDEAPPALVDFLSRFEVPWEVEETTRKELDLNEEWPVAEVIIHNPLAYPRIISQLQKRFTEREFFTCDIDVESLFFYRKGLFPLARVEVEVDREGWILDWEMKDDPWEIDYPLPPLSLMELTVNNSQIHPKQALSHGALLVKAEGCAFEIEPGFEVQELRRLFERYDPHLIVTDHGDDFLLAELSRQRGARKIPFNRDGTPVRRRGRARSYFTYGKVVYSAPSYCFRGRWHVDRQNSFVVHEAGMEGLFELARLSKTPLQKVARLSTGSIISSMQLETAIRLGYLIPWRKSTVEEPKTAEELLTIDKGGLQMQPRPGLYENVAEIDFSSMYPALMEKYNLSPETLNCFCCPDAPKIPETGYHSCQNRRGIVPRTIDALLQRRATYKARMEEVEPLIREVYDRRQTAIKWLLVTSFGYLGYKNARFGRIEAHESTTALGRQKLLLAKEVAERRGFTVLHALTDCVWVFKKDAMSWDYAALTDLIVQKTEIPAALEGIYRWLVFGPSREFVQSGVPNRFFGIFADGKTKIRGIEARRSDTCPFIREAQQEMLEALFQARSAKEYLEAVPQVQEILERYRLELTEGRAPIQKLAFSRRLSREPHEYRKANVTAIAAQELILSGGKIHAGEKLKVVITDSKAPFRGDRVKALPLWDGSRGYDADWYETELLKAGATVLFPAGLDLEKLRGGVFQPMLPVLDRHDASPRREALEGEFRAGRPA